MSGAKKGRKVKDIFNQSTTRLGGRITVRTAAKVKGLGYLDERTGEIVISDKQPRIAKFVVLMHELLHAVDCQLVGRVTKRRVAHDWITNAAPTLLALLSALEVEIPPWPEVRKFLNTLKPAPERKAKVKP